MTTAYEDCEHRKADGDIDSATTITTPLTVITARRMIMILAVSMSVVAASLMMRNYDDDDDGEHDDTACGHVLRRCPPAHGTRLDNCPHVRPP